jgi:putative SOS response-associated peptidase YedK
MHPKVHVRFGGGPMKKGRVDRHLVSGLPYLDPGSFDRWLDPNEQRAEVLQALLVPLPDDSLTTYPVSKLVNNPRNQGPQCIEPNAT